MKCTCKKCHQTFSWDGDSRPSYCSQCRIVCQSKHLGQNRTVVVHHEGKAWLVEPVFLSASRQKPVNVEGAQVGSNILSPIVVYGSFDLENWAKRLSSDVIGRSDITVKQFEDLIRSAIDKGVYEELNEDRKAPRIRAYIVWSSVMSGLLPSESNEGHWRMVSMAAFKDVFKAPVIRDEKIRGIVEG